MERNVLHIHLLLCHLVLSSLNFDPSLAPECGRKLPGCSASCFNVATPLIVLRLLSRTAQLGEAPAYIF